MAQARVGRDGSRLDVRDGMLRCRPGLYHSAAVLQGRELGPGSVHRAARELQRRFLAEPPEVPRNAPRWSRKGGGIHEPADY
jgi:hypothetical protein